MRSGMKYMAVAAALLLLTAGSQGAFAGCTNLGSGFAIFQCGFYGWFAPPPAAAGTIQPVWWMINYGNLSINTGAGGGTALEGTGNQSPATFNGNDSGLFNMVLTDAASVLPAYAGQIPAGALCSNYENSWSQPGVDGCADVPRTTADDDDILNPFFSAYGPSYCPYYYTYDKQIDYPMAVMLHESTGKYFALACLANKSRGADIATKCVDTSEGLFDLGTVVNGEQNPIFPTKNNIIPWQNVPVPHVDSVTILAPGGATGDRMLSLSWNNVIVHNDGSVRPSARAGLVAGGVGCLDMGNLVRFAVETAPLTDPNNANPAPSSLVWTPVQTMPAPDPTTDPTVTMSLTVPPDTAVRVRTLLGKVPRTASTGAAACRLGACGDVGFEAADPSVSPLLIIGGSLASQKVVDLDASTSKGKVVVTFRTTSETTLDSISILAVGNRGETVVRTLAPQQGTTGIGATYTAELSMSDLKGAKQIAVRLDGGGSLIDKSAPVSIR